MRSIRLLALESAPGVFLSCFEEEAVLEKRDWVSRVSDPQGAIFGLFDLECIIGLTGANIWSEDPSGRTAIFVMDFIHPDYRGLGLAKYLYESRIEWAKSMKCSRVRLGVRATNRVALETAKKFGFKQMDMKQVNWPDGNSDKEFIMERRLF
tara:strand:+ start:134 stop:589 length:456 start_codon:yes stop_codon:yes gene_type:complete